MNYIVVITYSKYGIFEIFLEMLENIGAMGGGGGIGDTSHTHLCRQIIDLVFNGNLSFSESLSKP